MEAIHPAGCQLTIVSDGRVFADIIGVPDPVVNSYHTELRSMLGPHIGVQRLDDFISGSPDTIREQLVQQYSQPLPELHQRLKAEPDLLQHYLGLVRFMHEDRIWNAEQSKSSIQRECKQIALQMLQRAEAYSALIRERFPDHVRLTIHPTSNVEKFSINIISGVDNWGTPWHNTVFQRADGTYALIKRREADQHGAVLVAEHGRSSYFRQ